MIGIKNYNKVFIACPACAVTGGPELLHQLAHHLRSDLKRDAYIYYFPSDYSDPVPEVYKEYQVPFVRKINDDKKIF
jgi:hypothetical protein